MLNNQTFSPERNNALLSKGFTMHMIHKLCGNTIPCELPHYSDQCRTMMLSYQLSCLSPSVDPKAPVIQGMVWSQKKIFFSFPHLYLMGNETKVGVSHYLPLVPSAFIFHSLFIWSIWSS